MLTGANSDDNNNNSSINNNKIDDYNIKGIEIKNETNTSFTLEFSNKENDDEKIIIDIDKTFNDILEDDNDKNDNESRINTIKTTLPLSSYLLSSKSKQQRDYSLPLVSVCLCMKNAKSFINETLLSVVLQTYNGPLELSVFDDLSTDDSFELVKNWSSIFKYYSIMLSLNGAKREEQKLLYTHSIAEYQSLVDRYHRVYPQGQIILELGTDAPMTESGGCGYARNKAIQFSHGDYICILDSDDIMYRERIELQLKECLEYKDEHVIVGSNFLRIPKGSSNRYTEWCNRLTKEDLYLHQYRECTIIQPTWFMKRETYYRIGGFTTRSSNISLYKVNESTTTSPTTVKNKKQKLDNNKNNKNNKKDNEKESSNNNNDNDNNNNIISINTIEEPKKHQPIPEDLIFFHKHLQDNGKLSKVNAPLMLYRFHTDNLSKQIHRLILLKIKLDYLEKRVIDKWTSFSIWGAGRDGKKLFCMLSDHNKNKVQAFCDVDTTKIGRNYNAAYTNQSIPIIHFSQVKPPIIMCVSLDRTNQEFENNIKSLNIIEGIDYWQFN